jgi:dihydroorotate dehydrogenase electron transfer subunit
MHANMSELYHNVKVIAHDHFGGTHARVSVAAPALARTARPGQFAMLKVGGRVPLLRRPLGIHDVQGTRVSFLYEIVGEGTRRLACLRKGDTLDLLGPLGNGFSFSSRAPRAHAHARPVLIAGGMGVAPLVFLARALGHAGAVPLVLIGGATKHHVLCTRQLRELGCTVLVATDDGSLGYKGYVSRLLERSIDKGVCVKAPLFACGPRPLLAAVARIAERCALSAQVSLEAHMACGIGACLGCAVMTRNGFRRVCKDGPVFDAQSIVWEDAR